MLAQPKIVFLRNKISELSQALFFNTSDAVLKLPTSLINALEVDEIGQVWFLVARPQQNIAEFERDMPASLHFYRKGVNYRLEVSGKASIISDPEDINSVSTVSEVVRKQLADNMVLVKMKVSEYKYHEHPNRPVAGKKVNPKVPVYPSTFFKSLQYIVKDIIPVFQSH